jgi:hypothetical protein
MKVLFLIITFLSFISVVRAQRQFNEYTCSLSHKYSETAFYLAVDEMKEVEVGGWKIHTGLRKNESEIVVTLKRKVNVMDATYHKEANESYPLTARTLPVELEHSFGGRTDVFNMVCYPRDP